MLTPGLEPILYTGRLGLILYSLSQLAAKVPYIAQKRYIPHSL